MGEGRIWWLRCGLIDGERWLLKIYRVVVEVREENGGCEWWVGKGE